MGKRARNRECNSDFEFSNIMHNYKSYFFSFAIDAIRLLHLKKREEI